MSLPGFGIFCTVRVSNVVAMFAWSVELLCAVATPGLPNRTQRACGAWLGVCAALMITARPGDGATLGVGLATCALRHDIF